MRRSVAVVFAGLMTLLVSWGAARAERDELNLPPPARSAPKAVSPAPPPTSRCEPEPAARRIAGQTRIISSAPANIGHGAPIEIEWRLPPAERGRTRLFLVGAMRDEVRFEGDYTLDASGLLERGPGFVALPRGSRAPYGFAFGAGRTRVVIPLSSTDVPRQGRLRVKPFAAGPIAIDWAVVAVEPDCGKAGAHVAAAAPVTRLGPYAVAAGAPRIVVQDFVAPDPRHELAGAEGRQKLVEVETSSDGRYRLDIFERRYRVFDRESGAKLVDRSGVKPRVSPGGRFVVASVGDAEKLYPTNFEVVDLLTGVVAARVGGPIVAWSNGDALLVDGARAYQGLNFFNTLIDPVVSADGGVASWAGFHPGCGTCDAWASSNVRFDWDRLTVLRGDGGERRAMGIAMLADGTKAETSSFGDEEAHPLQAKLRQVYGRAEVTLTKGWHGDAAFAITHVGRGYDGYVDDDVSLQPSEAGRLPQSRFVAARRLALAEGRIVNAADLQPLAAERIETRNGWRSTDGTASARLDDGYVADELAKLGLRLTPATAVAELAIARPADWADPIIRPWPADLKSQVLAADPKLATWFEGEEPTGIVVAAWRLEREGRSYLLLQHGEPAATVNGAHDLRFDLLTTDGKARGELRTFAPLNGLYSQYVGRAHTVARPFALPSGRFVIAVPGTGKAVLVLPDKEFAAVEFDLVEPTLLCGFHEAMARGLVVQSNCDGQQFVFDGGANHAPILSGRVVDGEVMLYAPQGFYASTYEGAHFVHVAFPGLPGVHSFEQFASELDRPQAIKAIIEGREPGLAPPQITPPPTVGLSARATSAGAITLEATAQSAHGLAAIEIFEDGRLVERRPAEGRQSTQVSTRPRLPHVRVASAVAVDRKGLRSRPASIDLPRLTGTAKTNMLHVVAIGIDAYDKMNPLSGARRDAETLVASVQGNAPYYRDVKATLRLDREATPARVAADLEAVVAAAGPDDTILVFFAGHGGLGPDGRYHLAVSATDPERLGQTAIDWPATARLLGTAKGRVIVVLDACHSGQTGLTDNANDAAVAALAGGAAAPMIVLAASKGRQLSEEMPRGGGGVFTQTLARLVGADRATTDGNGDGVLAISEIYRSLKQVVETTTAGRQTPWLVRRNIVGDPPLL